VGVAVLAVGACLLIPLKVRNKRGGHR